MKTSETLSTDFHKAYDNLQQKITAVRKGGVNPHFKNKYTTLESVIDYVKPIAHKCGFTIMQTLDIGEDNIGVVTTRLSHIDTAEWIESTALCPMKDKGNPQHYGSAVTYGRRYSIKSLCFMSETDDDGEDATGRNDKPEPKQAPFAKVNYGLSDLEKMELNIIGIKTIGRIDKARTYLETATEFSAKEKDDLSKLIDEQAGKVMKKQLGGK
jgi:hypothetical protein